MDSIKTLHRLLSGASRMTIAVHSHPDGDALGSGVAMLRYLSDILGKDAVLALPDSAPRTLSFVTAAEPEGKVMYLTENPEAVKKRIESSDLLICQDCNTFSRTGGLAGLLESSTARKVLIDHHLAPDVKSFDLTFSRTEVSSTCELLFDILMQMPEIEGDATKLPKACISALMTGMTTDTNNFANSVHPGTMNMASKLIAAGADREGILGALLNSYRENRIRLMGYLLDKKLRITSEGAAIMVLDKATQSRFDFQDGESEGFVNIPLSIAEVKLSVFLTEEDDRFRVSVRSKKGTSANLYALTYCNGGGHEQASGGKLPISENIASANDAEAYILNTTEEFLKK